MRSLLSLLAALAVVLVAGCGDSKDSLNKAVADAKSAATAAQTPPTRTVTIERTATAPEAGCATVSEPDPHPERTHQTASTTILSPKKQWTVILDTNCGLISIDLAVRQSPKTTAAFAGLVAKGFFNDLTFHRVSTGPDGQPFVIQGGDPLGTGLGGPGFQVVEPPPSNADYSRGVVAMAKTATDPSGASGSQFFIVTGADAGLPPQYALLGHVSAGQATVARIAAQPTQGNEMPVSPVVIRAAALRSH